MSKAFELGKNIKEAGEAFFYPFRDPVRLLRSTPAAHPIFAGLDFVANFPEHNRSMQQGLSNFARGIFGYDAPLYPSVEPIPEAPPAGRPLPEELQGLGALDPYAPPPPPAKAPPQAPPKAPPPPPEVPYRVPRRQVVEPELIPPVDFSEVRKVLEESRPEDLPGVSKFDMVISILGQMASGAAQAVQAGASTGGVIAAAGAGAARGFAEGRQEDVRRRQINSRQRTAFGLEEAQIKSRQLLENAGIDARNVALMNEHKQRIADAQFEYELALLPKMEISPWGITVAVPDPETGRMVFQQVEGPAFHAARLREAGRMAGGLSRAMGIKSDPLKDIKIGMKGIQGDTANPLLTELHHTAMLYITGTPNGRAEFQALRNAAARGESGDPFLDRVGTKDSVLDPTLLNDAVIEHLLTKRLQLYTENPEIAKQDRLLARPLEEVRRERSLPYLMQLGVEDSLLGDALDPYFGQ